MISVSLRVLRREHLACVEQSRWHAAPIIQTPAAESASRRAGVLSRLSALFHPALAKGHGE